MPDEAGPSGRRVYTSPLRERQAQQTRDGIIDALTALLADRAPDEVTTKELARAAGVAESTVYRHFPDRSALVEALAARLAALTGPEPELPQRLDDLKPIAVSLMAGLEAHHVEARAEALFNSDPRRYTSATSAHGGQMREIVRRALPELDDEQQRGVAAILRMLVSAQAWLRMREEFGLPGDASGPVVAWAIDAIVHQLGRGVLPPRTD